MIVRHDDTQKELIILVFISNDYLYVISFY